MVLPETDQDETDDEQEITHSSNIKEDSGLALCLSEENGGRDGGKEGYSILKCVPLLINTGTSMVLPESEDETDNEQERTRIGNMEEDSGLVLFFSEEMGGRVDGWRQE